jgi:selenoprotein W-related protein
LATRLLNTYRSGIKDLRLIPAGGGVFEVEVNGQLVYSKKAVGKFPDEQVLVADLQKKFPAAA